MTDHIAALSRIPDTEMARLKSKSTAKGLRHLALHLGLIGLTGGLIALQAPLWWLLLPIHGVLLTFLFTLEHECTHQTPFENARLCDWVGRVCGIILILPFTWFRYFHLAHHRFTNDPKRDPELLNGAKPTTLGKMVIHLTGFGYWRGVTKQLLINALGKADAPYLPVSAASRIVWEARWMFIVYAVVLSTLIWSPLAFRLWVLPMILGQPALRLYLLAEHGRLPYVSNMLENTRTTYTNAFIRFIAWNMPYHAEHHAAPQVPFHQLPQLNAVLKDELQATADGYARYTTDEFKKLA